MASTDPADTPPLPANVEHLEAERSMEGEDATDGVSFLGFLCYVGVTSLLIVDASTKGANATLLLVPAGMILAKQQRWPLWPWATLSIIALIETTHLPELALPAPVRLHVSASILLAVGALILVQSTSRPAWRGLAVLFAVACGVMALLRAPWEPLFAPSWPIFLPSNAKQSFNAADFCGHIALIGVLVGARSTWSADRANANDLLTKFATRLSTRLLGPLGLIPLLLIGAVMGAYTYLGKRRAIAAHAVGAFFCFLASDVLTARSREDTGVVLLLPALVFLYAPRLMTGLFFSTTFVAWTISTQLGVGELNHWSVRAMAMEMEMEAKLGLALLSAWCVGLALYDAHSRASAHQGAAPSPAPTSGALAQTPLKTQVYALTPNAAVAITSAAT